MSSAPLTSGDNEPAAAPDLLQLTRQKLKAYARALHIDRRRVLLALSAVGIAWVATGFYRVQPEELGIVLQFGRMTGVSGPGLHYRAPYPIGKVLLPNVTRVNQLQVGHVDTLPTKWGNQMLTGDENIVDADCSVFWRISDPVKFMFGLDDPERTLAVLAESAVREVVGRNPIQSALSDRRQQIADDVQSLLQQLLDGYGAGMSVTQVQLQRVDPPHAVIDAFNDVQRARADQERARNEAEAYRNDVIPRARAEADRIQQEAEAYKTQVISLAEGDTTGFLDVYKAYRLAPDATAWRMYLDSLDELFKKASKVIIDASGKGVSGIVPYMPLTSEKRTAAVPSIAIPTPPSDGARQ